MSEQPKLLLAVKRTADILVSALVLIVGAPLWVCIAALVAATSPGPVFFRQTRPGKGGRPFRIYKFRTMHLGSEVMVKGCEVARDDKRVTRVGRLLRRTKLDEIPQLVNILKGDMSLVGPRPERMDSVAAYSSEVARRLHVRPGLTGLAQVSGNIYLQLADRYRLDVFYVDNLSISLDLAIIARTIGVVLFGEDRYVNRQLVRID